MAAGALRLEDAVSVVRLRGEAMQRAVPQGTGAMAAIMGVPPEQLELICQEASEGEVVSPANFNAPGQIVIAGHAAAVSRASKLVSERQGKAIPLKVSAPFHCALMAPAREALAARLGSVEVSPLSFPVIANVDARPNLDPSRVKGLLVQQVDHPVRWEETIRAMASRRRDPHSRAGSGQGSRRAGEADRQRDRGALGGHRGVDRSRIQVVLLATGVRGATDARLTPS